MKVSAAYRWSVPKRRVCSSRNRLRDPGKQRIERIQQMRLPFDPLDAMRLRLREFLEQGGGDVSGKTLQHGCHAQLALPCQDLLLQLGMTLNPSRGATALPTRPGNPSTETAGTADRPGTRRSASHSSPAVGTPFARRLPGRLLPRAC